MTTNPFNQQILIFLLKLVQEPKTGEDALRCLGRIEQEIVHALAGGMKSGEGVQESAKDCNCHGMEFSGQSGLAIPCCTCVQSETEEDDNGCRCGKCSNTWCFEHPAPPYGDTLS